MNDTTVISPSYFTEKIYGDLTAEHLHFFMRVANTNGPNNDPDKNVWYNADAECATEFILGIARKLTAAGLLIEENTGRRIIFRYTQEGERMVALHNL